MIDSLGFRIDMIDNPTLLQNAFSRLVDLTEEESDAISAWIVLRTFKKGQFLCAHEQTEQYLSIIQSGVCRGFYQRDGEEISVAFMFEGDYVSAYYSFLTQRPSLMTLEALSDVSVYSLSKTHLDELCQMYKSAERIGRLNAERIYRRKEERELSLLTLSATQRYLDLVQRYPQIIQRIPLKYISSYLGIQPASLSRIRKQLSEE